MKISPIQALLPKHDAVKDPPSFFGSIKDEFNHDFKKLNYDVIKTKNYYIYQIKKGDQTATGLVCLVDRQTILDNKILKHEQIIKDKSLVIKDFIKKSGAMTKPIMALHEKDVMLMELYETCTADNQPAFTTQIGDETHSIFMVNPEWGVKIENAFIQRVLDAFIADGHHRFDSMQKLLQEESLIKGVAVVFFGQDQIHVEAYNRLVQKPYDFDSSVFLSDLKNIFDLSLLEIPSFPSQKGEITMLFENKWYKLTLHQIHLQAQPDVMISTTDIEVVTKEIFSDILGLTTDHKSIKYLNMDETKQAILSSIKKNEILFCFYPISVEEIIKVSRNGRFLLPKSTWFEPKVRSGVIVGKF